MAWWLLILAGCAPECDVGVTDMHTVLRADVTTPGAERLRVVYEAEGTAHSTALEAEAGRDHHALLFDLGPLVDVAWRVLDADDDEVCSGEAATENLPGGTPSWSADGAETLGGYWVIPRIGSEMSHITSAVDLFRADGTYIWSYLVPTTDRQVVSADLTPAGVRFNVFDALRTEDVATIDVVGLDGGVVSSTRTAGAHHFYTPVSDGAAVYLRAEQRETSNFGCVVGDTLVEQAADGSERVVWSAWDTFPVTPSSVWDAGFYGSCKDWTHGSGLSWRADDDTLLVTLLGPQQIVHVSRATGRVLATFGDRWEIPTAPGSPPFKLPHSATWASDGRLLVFDGHEDISESGCYSYRIDPDSGTLINDRRWIDGEHLGMFLGGVAELPDGRIACKWGADGFVRVFPPDAQTPDYEARVDGLYQLGAAAWYPDLTLLGG